MVSVGRVSCSRSRGAAELPTEADPRPTRAPWTTGRFGPHRHMRCLSGVCKACLASAKPVWRPGSLDFHTHVMDTAYVRYVCIGIAGTQRHAEGGRYEKESTCSSAPGWRTQGAKTPGPSADSRHSLSLRRGHADCPPSRRASGPGRYRIVVVVGTEPQPEWRFEHPQRGVLHELDFLRRGGDSENSTATDTLIESWNGTSWTMVASPDDSSTQNSLAWVSCTSPTFCVAVGYEDYPTSEPTPLIDTWNGSSWSAASAPVPTSNSSYLYGVSVPAHCL